MLCLSLRYDDIEISSKSVPALSNLGQTRGTREKRVTAVVAYKGTRGDVQGFHCYGIFEDFSEARKDDIKQSKTKFSPTDSEVRKVPCPLLPVDPLLLYRSRRPPSRLTVSKEFEPTVYAPSIEQRIEVE